MGERRASAVSARSLPCRFRTPRGVPDQGRPSRASARSKRGADFQDHSREAWRGVRTGAQLVATVGVTGNGQQQLGCGWVVTSGRLLLMHLQRARAGAHDSVRDSCVLGCEAERDLSHNFVCFPLRILVRIRDDSSPCDAIAEFLASVRPPHARTLGPLSRKPRQQQLITTNSGPCGAELVPRGQMPRHPVPGLASSMQARRWRPWWK